MVTSVIDFFANVLPVKTVMDESKNKMSTECLIELKNALIACFAHEEVTYEDVCDLGQVIPYWTRMLNLETISHLESNHLKTKTSISLTTSEEQFELVLAILRFDDHLYTEEAARQFLNAYISLLAILLSPSKIPQLSVTWSSPLLRISISWVKNRRRRLLISLPSSVLHGNVVALCFSRGISRILVILAVSPLEPGRPTLRKEPMVEECGAKIISIDDPLYLKRIAKYSADSLDVKELSSSGLACIITGIQPGARVMSSLTSTLDPFIIDVFGVLSQGATLVNGCKAYHVKPWILAIVPVDENATLHTVVVAEFLGKKIIEDWYGRVTSHNMYGPTEAFVDCTSYHVTRPAITGVIGRLRPASQLPHLHSLKPTPICIVGDLYIGGIKLARGYLN
ncbi:hypothetical protein ID866_9249 [Astraeus odoratus]|nr:hypothetical protein ID866_9249 [Astraeus odoratus]